MTGLQRDQLPALLYKVNAGVKQISPTLLRSGPQRDPLLHRVASIAKALNEPHTWDPSRKDSTEPLQDVVCHWKTEEAKEIPAKLGISWGPHVLHQPLTWEGVNAANGRVPKTEPLTDAERQHLRAKLGRRAANSEEHWRKMRRILQARALKREALSF